MGTRKDLTGKKFNMLTPIKFAGKAKDGTRLWKCKCDCGKTTIVRTTLITTDRTKSCGCIRKYNYVLPKGEAAFNHVYARYKKSCAKSRGHKFILTKEEFKEIISQDCYYCGTKPGNIYKDHRLNGSYTYNGIDRVDNSKGYTKENCVPCCFQCNVWKKADNQQDFIDHANKISENMKRK